MEFDIIDHYFRSHPQSRQDVILGIGDDCALLMPRPGQILAMSTDTMVIGVHYDVNTHPLAVGHKSLAVSLSDLAAMGAEPAWVMLSLNLDKIDEQWLALFCQGFFTLLDKYGVSLIGGNMSSGFPAITTQVTGFLPVGKGLRRSGAKPGDKIFVTGSLGDAALGLFIRAVTAKPASNISSDYCEQQCLALQTALDFPAPRISEGLALRDIASAAIDISDGLVADLGHMLQQSNVGATVYIEAIPLSQAARQVVAAMPAISFDKMINFALSGGDDYELCFTASAENILKLEQAFQRLDCSYTCIGVIEPELGLRLIHQGQPLNIERTGYQHF